MRWCPPLLMVLCGAPSWICRPLVLAASSELLSALIPRRWWRLRVFEDLEGGGGAKQDDDDRAGWRFFGTDDFPSAKGLSRSKACVVEWRWRHTIGASCSSLTPSMQLQVTIFSSLMLKKSSSLMRMSCLGES
jgi:hypothetical protein